MQYYVPQVTCEKLDRRVPGAIDVPAQKAVACQSQSKFLLDVAKVAGTDIDEATPQIEQNTGQRVVSLNFKGDGQNKWTELTREAYQNSGDPKCDQSRSR